MEWWSSGSQKLRKQIWTLPSCFNIARNLESICSWGLPIVVHNLVCRCKWIIPLLFGIEWKNICYSKLWSSISCPIILVIIIKYMTTNWLLDYHLTGHLCFTSKSADVGPEYESFLNDRCPTLDSGPKRYIRVTRESVVFLSQSFAQVSLIGEVFERHCINEEDIFVWVKHIIMMCSFVEGYILICFMQKEKSN